MLPFALFLLALLLFYLARRTRALSGLPTGRVVYTDTGGWTRNEAPLYSAALQLTGKPDYLVKQRGGGVVPVEVKSAAAPAGGPHAGHLYQLAAYCALVAEAYGRRPAFGLIKYADRTLEIPYTPALEADLRQLLSEIRAARQAADVPRSHNSPARCRGCGVEAVCDQSLADAQP
jgi:CRISPR-associated exonuclease Cas4